jgi:hypothetical protein
MNKITIQPFTASHVPAVVELQSAYTEVYPEAQVMPGELYLSPGFEGNVFCAMDESGNLVGYAPLYPVLMRDESKSPHTLWVEVKAHPESEAMTGIKDQLWERILLRAREVTARFPSHRIHLTFEYLLSETASIAYVTSKGCQHTESVFIMRRHLSQEIQSPQTVEACDPPWRMESEAEQRMYIQARNECFTEAPVELAEWQYFMRSPHWSVGTTFAAFHGDELVGNVAVFWDEAENQKSGNRIGFTEYIFVAPWREKMRQSGQCRACHSKGHGLAEAHLSPRKEPGAFVY